MERLRPSARNEMVVSLAACHMSRLRLRDVLNVNFGSVHKGHCTAFNAPSLCSCQWYMCLGRYLVCYLYVSTGSHHSLAVLSCLVSSVDVAVASIATQASLPVKTVIELNMSSLPIRGPQNASGADELSVGALPKFDYETYRQDVPISNSPASPSSANTSHVFDPDSKSDPETHSNSPVPSDHVSEWSGSEHMDWSPTSPLISNPGHSGISSDDDVNAIPGANADADDDADADNTTTDNPESVQELTSLLPLPTSSPSCLTHAHQQAMANRITYDQLLSGSAFDPAMYTPVFLHNTLMLPGSLAALLGKVSFPRPNHHRRITQN